MKTSLVIFGITGDLSGRYLLPSLANITKEGRLGELSIIGVSRREVDKAQVLGECYDTLGDMTSIFQMDLDNGEDYARLKQHIEQTGAEQVLFYLSVPPESASGIITHLGQAGLNASHHKLLLEKPFGRDLDSAQAMIDHTAQYFDESQSYRIDHYLAKEMAQNIVTFRARNAIFSHLWSSEYIERIEVVALETLTIEGRAAFYEQTGALRDIVQGHLLQLLALTIAPLPANFEWDDLPRYRQQALDALEYVDTGKAIRAQYQGYRDEVNNQESTVETFVSLELKSSDPTWRGIPLALTAGKALSRRKTEVRVHFRRRHDSQSNYLLFRIQPDEGIAIDLVTKKPGYDQEVEHQKLSYSYPAGERLPNAYEQVLVDAMTSDKSLFATSGEVLRAWEVLAPLQDAWKISGDIRFYEPSSDAKSIIEQS